MKIILRNPKREVELSGRRRVKELLTELDILAGTVLVIRGDELLTSDSVVLVGLYRYVVRDFSSSGAYCLRRGPRDGRARGRSRTR